MQATPGPLATRLRTLGAALAALCLLAPGAALATLIASPSDSALSGALVVDFDSEATGDFSSRTFLSGLHGFTVSPVSGSLQIEGSWCDDFGTTNNCLGTNSAGGANDDFDVVFTGSGVSAFGFALNALDRDWTIETYDSDDNLLNTYVYLSQSPGVTGFDRRGFFGATEAVPVQSFTVRSTGGDDWALVDDFRFIPAPEPGSGLLAGLGLIGLAYAGRPQRR